MLVERQSEDVHAAELGRERATHDPRQLDSRRARPHLLPSFPRCPAIDRDGAEEAGGERHEVTAGCGARSDRCAAFDRSAFRIDSRRITATWFTGWR